MDTFSLPITVVLLVAREREEEIERASERGSYKCLHRIVSINKSKILFSLANCYEAAELQRRLLAALISTSHWFHSRSKLEKHHNDSRNEKGGRERRRRERCEERRNVSDLILRYFSPFHFHIFIISWSSSSFADIAALLWLRVKYAGNEIHESLASEREREMWSRASGVWGIELMIRMMTDKISIT